MRGRADLRGGLKTYNFRFFDIFRFTNTDVGVRLSYTRFDIAFGYRDNTSDRRNEVWNLRGSVWLDSGIQAANPHFRLILARILGYVIPDA
jgi:hypothetical protein